MTTAGGDGYAARLNIDYPASLDRVTSAFRLIWAIPIAIVYSALTASQSNQTVMDSTGGMTTVSSGIIGGLAFATALMIVFRRKYPRWWFDFARELTRFGTRVGAYVGLLTDRYPSTDEEQSVHLEIDYPDVESLNQWLPLIKWLIAIPHYIILIFLSVIAILAVIIAWFAILFTGRYPRGLFDYVVGVARWWLRVQAYAFLLVTDEYPPFSLT